MKVLMTGTDRKIFEKGSKTRDRIARYGQIFDELHLVVYTNKKESLEKEKISSNVYIYPTNSTSKLFFGFDLFKVVKQNLLKGDKLDVDIISSQDSFEMGFFTWLLSRVYKKRIHFQIHTDIFNSFYRNRGIRNYFQYLLTTFLLPKASGIRVVSEKIRNDVVGRYPKLKDKITVLPLYTEVDVKDPKFEVPDDKTILVISRFSHEKNVPQVVEIFDKVKKRVPEARLLIIGEGGQKGDIENEITKRGLDEDTKILPWQKNINSFYENASVLLQTSYFEGFSMVHVEAAASGIPIVTSETGVFVSLDDEIKEICVCNVQDVECFSSKVAGMLTDKKEREEFFKKVRPLILEKSSLDFGKYLSDYKLDFEKTKSQQT